MSRAPTPPPDATSRRRWIVIAALAALIAAALLLYEYPICCAPKPLDVEERVDGAATRGTAQLAPIPAIAMVSGTGALAPERHRPSRRREGRSA